MSDVMVIRPLELDLPDKMFRSDVFPNKVLKRDKIY